MQSLRVLKKLSKRAAPLLPLLGDCRQQFPAERGDNYTGLTVKGRKHWERHRSPNEDVWGGQIKRPAKDGRGFIGMRSPSHPLKGTVMVGERSGYYEPEWEEETAWEALSNRLWWDLTNWTDDGEPIAPKGLNGPSDYFRAAAKMIATQHQPSR